MRTITRLIYLNGQNYAPNVAATSVRTGRPEPNEQDLRKPLSMLLDRLYKFAIGDNRSMRERFFGKISIAIFLISTPSALYALASGSWLTRIVTLGIYLSIPLNIYLVRIRKIELALLNALFLSYGFLASAPLHIGSFRSILLYAVANYLVISYTTGNRHVQTLNNILLFFTFVIHQFLCDPGLPLAVSNPKLLDHLSGLSAMIIIAFVVYFYNRELGMLRRKEKQNFNFLHAISQFNPLMIFTKDLDRKYTYLNRSFEEFLDIDSSLAVGKTTAQLGFQSVDLQDIDRNDQVILSGESPKIMTHQTLVSPNGETKFIEIIKSPLYGDQNTIQGILAVAIDVSAKFEKEKELARSFSLLSSTIESTADGILVTDLKGKIVMFNQRFLEKWRLPPGIDNKECEELLYQVSPQLTDPKGFIDRVRELQQKHEEISEDLIQFNDGRLYERYSHPQVMNGEIVGRVWSYRDITRQKMQEVIIQQTNARLKEKNAQLEKYIESNMQLENFAYLASHDLKTPIRNIINFTQLLQRSAASKLDAGEREFLDFLQEASRNMNQLIEDLLTYSRVNTRKHQIQPIRLRDEIQGILKENKTYISQKQALVKIDRMPDTILADRIQMKQLFQNLILNAVKFSKPATTPEVRVVGEEKQDHWLFSIQDRGIGIDAEFHNKIFLLFKKLHAAKEYDGTGIGLAMCKKIVERHRGKIWVDSENGKGATFHFTLSKEL